MVQGVSDQTIEKLKKVMFEAGARDLEISS